MKKWEVVKNNDQFNNIINNGKLLKNPYYVIYYLKSDEDFPKFGIAVGKKIGNAVMRNKCKRQLRVIIDKYKKLFSNSYNYIIMIRKEFINLSFLEKEQYFLELIKKGKHNEKN